MTNFVSKNRASETGVAFLEQTARAARKHVATRRDPETGEPHPSGMFFDPYTGEVVRKMFMSRTLYFRKGVL